MSEEGMVNQTAQTFAEAAAEQPPNGHGPGGPAIPEWSPPRTRAEADQAVISLSNDIGLILAQLAEDQVAWCARTGRTPADYAGWKRRALFAKVHKEGQLRECKRIRTQLASTAIDPDDAATALASAAELLAWCRLVVESWLDDGTPSTDGRLGQALARLAEYLDEHDCRDPGGAMDLRGSQARPVRWERPMGREPAALPPSDD